MQIKINENKQTNQTKKIIFFLFFRLEKDYTRSYVFSERKMTVHVVLN